MYFCSLKFGSTVSHPSIVFDHGMTISWEYCLDYKDTDKQWLCQIDLIIGLVVFCVAHSCLVHFISPLSLLLCRSVSA